MAIAHTISPLSDLGRANVARTPVAASAAARVPLSIEVARGDVTLLNTLWNEWDALCAEGPCFLPFFTPAWISTWIESFAPKARLVILIARRQGQLRGLLPLIEQRTGIGRLSFTRLSQPGNVHSNRLDIVHGSGDCDEVVGDIWRALKTQVRWDLIDFRDAPDGGAFQRMVGLAESERYPVITRATLESPYIPLSGDTNVEELGPKKQLRRSRRQLEREGGYTHIRHEPVTEEQVAALIAMEMEGWKGRNGTAIACNEEERAFYTKFMLTRSDSMTPVIHELRRGDKPIAFNLGIEMGQNYVEPKGTYAEEERKYGPGHLIIHEIVGALQKRGFTRFGLLGHVEPYKELWTSTTIQHRHYLLFRRSPRGQALRTTVDMLIPFAKRWRGRMTAATAKVLAMIPFIHETTGTTTWML